MRRWFYVLSGFPFCLSVKITGGNDSMQKPGLDNMFFSWYDKRKMIQTRTILMTIMIRTAIICTRIM